MKKLGILLIFLLLAGLAVCLSGCAGAEDDSLQLMSADFSDGAGSLRIVFLSDIHWEPDHPDSELHDLVGAINDLMPDIVLLGGDYGIDPDTSVAFFEKLKDIHIQSRYGVYGIIGEADRVDFPMDPDDLVYAMMDAGVQPLVNRVVPISLPGSQAVFIAGVDDVINGFPDIADIAGQIHTSDYVIFAAHDPCLLGEAMLIPDADGSTNWIDIGFFGYADMRDPDWQEEGPGWIQKNGTEVFLSPVGGAICCSDVQPE